MVTTASVRGSRSWVALRVHVPHPAPAARATITLVILVSLARPVLVVSPVAPVAPVTIAVAIPPVAVAVAVAVSPVSITVAAVAVAVAIPVVAVSTTIPVVAVTIPVMAVTIPWALSEGLRARGLWRGRLFSAAAAQCACIIVTYSRGGALGMAMALVAFALFARHRSRALALVCVAALAVAVLAPRSFWERTHTIGNYQLDASAQGRLRAWETGWTALREHPALGIGAGGYLRAWDRYQPRNVRERAYTSHNMWMQVAVELGLFGLAAFALMLALMLRGLWRARRDRELAGEARALLASFVALLACGTTGGYAFNWFFYMALGVAGAVVAASRVPRARRIDGLQLAVA